MQTTTVRSSSQAMASRKSSFSSGSKSQGKKKKSQQPKSNGSGKEGPAGPQPVVPPPISGPWGNPKSVTSSAPPPGFASNPPKATSVGFSDAHMRQLRHRALFAFRFLVGRAVNLQLVAPDERYAGSLDCIDPDNFSIVLKNAKRLNSGANTKPFADGSTVIFRLHQIAYLVADGAINYTDGVFAPGKSAVSGGFCTDTEISGQKGEHLFGRELEAASSWLDPALDTGALEESTSNNRRHSKNQGNAGWNQFEVNEKLFGVVSTYDENIYTTKLDKTKISTEQSLAAEKLAHEIEHQSAAGNFHLQEERGQAGRGGRRADDLDEEARYSSVDRRTLTGSSENAYVPPALRKAQRPASGDDSQVKATKTPPAVAPSAATTPAPAAVPAAPKPLSFSEAVTGRSAAVKPEVAPKTSLKGRPEGKKVAPASPQGAASSPQVNGDDAKPASAKSKVASPKKKNAASGKEKTKECKDENEGKSKPSPSSSSTSTTMKGETPKVVSKKGLNPNAKEFKLSASAAEFTPSFSVPPAVRENASSPYRGGSPGHMPYPHPGMSYPPVMQEEWMYDGVMSGEEGGEIGMAPYMQGGYTVPMGINGVPMMYPPMMLQQNMRMMSGGQRGNYGGYQQQGYNPQGYYSSSNGGYPGVNVPYSGGPSMLGGVGPQPPLPPTPSGEESFSESSVDAAPVPPVPETAPEVECASESSKQTSSASKKE